MLRDQAISIACDFAIADERVVDQTDMPQMRMGRNVWRLRGEAPGKLHPGEVQQIQAAAAAATAWSPGQQAGP